MPILQETEIHRLEPEKWALDLMSRIVAMNERILTVNQDLLKTLSNPVYIRSKGDQY